MKDYIYKFYETNSYISNQSKDNKEQEFNSDMGTIYDYSLHYFCTKCLKFPFIEFCKDRKNIRLTCSCFNNEKILIKDLFSQVYSFHFSIKSNIYFSTTNNDNDIENVLFCKKHNKQFKGFSKNFLNNYCQDCINKKSDNDIIIYFDDIKIEDKKILQLLNKIKDHNDANNIHNINNNEDMRIFNINSCKCEISSIEEEQRFKNLINIIINDYKNYPNFSHFF